MNAQREVDLIFQCGVRTLEKLLQKHGYACMCCHELKYKNLKIESLIF